MLFLNTWMLLGLLGIAVPVIIHLLNRRQARLIDWGAMQFLLDSLISRRRRVLLEEILLLAARCLLVGLVALAVSRPFIPASSNVPWGLVLPAGLLAIVFFGISFALWRYPLWRRRVLWTAAVLAAVAVTAVLCERWLNLRRFGRGGSRDVAIVIDGSSSMTMQIDGETNFRRAVKEAGDYIQACPRGVAFSLIVAGSVPNSLTPAPITDRKHLLRLLDDAVPVQGTMQALDTLAVAATSLAQGYNGAKQIVLIGDGQSVGWNMGDADTWRYLQQAFETLPSRPQVVWRKLGLPASIRNLTLSDIVFSREVVGTDRDVRIDVTVANTGMEAATPQAVKLVVEGKPLLDRTLGQMQPGDARTVSFMHRFAQPGGQVVHAAVDVEDELAADNGVDRVVAVASRLRVLVAEGGGSARLAERAGAFIALGLLPKDDALRPRPADAEGDADFLVEPELVLATELASRDHFDAYAAVVLADVPRLTPETAERLAAYVSRGGGLAVVHGGRSDAAFYNEWRAGERLLPLALASLVVGGSTNRVALDPRTLTHPAVQSLAESGDLEGAFFERYWSAVEGDAATIGGRLSNGAPLFAERRMGKGTVLQFLAGLDPSAGNLVSRQSFVPFVHELIYHLARPVAPNLNILPTAGVTLNLSGGGDETGRSTGGGGLRAEYFRSQGKRRPALVRVDPQINFQWGAGAAARHLPPDHFRVEWTGTITPPRTGHYRIFGDADERMWVWAGPQTARSRSARVSEVRLDMEARKAYDIRAIYEEETGNARAILLWEGPGIPAQPIPGESLSPYRGRPETWSEGIETFVRGPDRQNLPASIVTSQDGVSLRIDHNLVPGLYSVQVPGSMTALLDSLSSASDGEERFPFCVIADGNESRLLPLTSDEIAFVRRHIDLLVADRAEDVLAALRGRAFGRELWRTLAIAAFLLLVAEIALPRWIAIQRRTGEEGSVAFEDAGRPSEKFREQLAHVRGTGSAGA